MRKMVWAVSIPDQIYHRFRFKFTTDSNPNLPPNPEQVYQRIRSNLPVGVGPVLLS
jgi:hypothetical protein